MTELQKEFEAIGYTSWINADLYPDGKIYTQEYTRWLESQVLLLRQTPVSGSLHLRDLQYLEAELKRRQDLIQSEPDGIVRETMIDNLLDGLFSPSKIAIELGFEYEMFFESKEDDLCKIDGWFPIATDRIVRPEKIEHYIETGLLRRVVKQ